MSSLSKLPSDLPIPIDDGACEHLTGIQMPDISLSSTDGGIVNLSDLDGITVIYIYPMTGHPDKPLPIGWNDIPGARGCTPQSCSFRDNYEQLKKLNTKVFGLSTQSTDYQQEASTRLHLPYPLLSDKNLEFANRLSLPTIDIEGMILIKRLTLICDNQIIKKVFYPVFPPDKNVDEVIKYLKKNH